MSYYHTADVGAARRSCKTAIERQQFDGLVPLFSKLTAAGIVCWFKVDLQVADPPMLCLLGKKWHIVNGGDGQGFDLWLTPHKPLQFNLTLEQVMARCCDA